MKVGVPQNEKKQDLRFFTAMKIQVVVVVVVVVWVMTPCSFVIGYQRFRGPCCIHFHFTSLHSTPLHSTPLHPVPLHSTPPQSISLHSDPLHSTSTRYFRFWLCHALHKPKGRCKKTGTEQKGLRSSRGTILCLHLCLQ